MSRRSLRDYSARLRRKNNWVREQRQWVAQGVQPRFQGKPLTPRQRRKYRSVINDVADNAKPGNSQYLIFPKPPVRASESGVQLEPVKVPIALPEQGRRPLDNQHPTSGLEQRYAHDRQ